MIPGEAIKRASWAGLAIVSGSGISHAVSTGLPMALLVSIILASLSLVALTLNTGVQRRSGGRDAEENPASTFQTNLKLHRLTLLVDQVPTPLLMADAAGRITVKNRAARRLFATNGVIAKPPPELVRAITERPPPRTIVLENAPLTSTFHVLITHLSQWDEDVRLLVLTDIRAEISATEAQQVRTMLEIVGHEIMNGIAPMVSLAATTKSLLANADAASIDKARSAVDTLCRRAESVLGFTETFREFVRLPPPSLADHALADVTLDLKLLFENRWEAERVMLEISDTSANRRARIDQSQITQALWALLQNAAEATLTNDEDDRSVAYSVSEDDAGILIRIADNGAGFGRLAPEDAFQPFVSSKKGGSGIGLSLARQIVRAHGGDVTVADTSGNRGVAMEVRL